MMLTLHTPELASERPHLSTADLALALPRSQHLRESAASLCKNQDSKPP